MTADPEKRVGIRFCASCLAIYRQDFQRCPLDGASLVVGANDPWIGLTVGAQYVIDELLGEGAMARVYRAHHRNFRDRRYAIKIMIGDLAASAQMCARFELEAAHAARLSHPNVVGVLDFGATERGISYMVMELVEGATLGKILREGPMEPERVIILARQIAEGLDHAHDRGMIHRDLKPDNVLVLSERDLEIARIADFGLALSKDNETRLTTTGVVCTPAYAAPEQLRGETIDQRVDLYALGVTMFEMLSGGILPFAGDVDTSVTCKLSNEAPSILMAAQDTPPALVAIISRLLAAAPERRPRSARAVIRALDQALCAPRVMMKTDQTARLRLQTQPDPADEAQADSTARATANARSGLRIDSIIPTHQRRVRRVAMQLCACALTLGGVLAWADMHDPTPVRAEPALVRTAEPSDVSAANETEAAFDVDALRSVSACDEPAPAAASVEHVATFDGPFSIRDSFVVPPELTLAHPHAQGGCGRETDDAPLLISAADAAVPVGKPVTAQRHVVVHRRPAAAPATSRAPKPDAAEDTQRSGASMPAGAPPAADGTSDSPPEPSAEPAAAAPDEQPETASSAPLAPSAAASPEPAPAPPRVEEIPEL